MTKYVLAWCAKVPPASPSITYRFVVGAIYPLAIKKRWFGRKIFVYKRSGYDDNVTAGSLHQFPSMQEFKKCWQIIKEDR